MRRLKVTFALLVLLALLAPPASAEVRWSARAEWGPSILEPGGKGQLIVHTGNYGTSPSGSPAAKIVEQLPAGVIATAVRTDAANAGQGANCQGTGTSTVSCTITSTVPALDAGVGGPVGGLAPRGPVIIIDLRVSPSVSGTGTNTLTVSGGGDPTPAVAVDEVVFGKAPEQFGVNPSTYAGGAFDAPFPADGAPFAQAGGHPADLRFAFDFNQRLRANKVAPDQTFLEPIGRVRTVAITLPPGLIGNPEAVPKCQPLDFLSIGQDPWQATGCPPSTQVGTLDVQLGIGSDGDAAVGGADLGLTFNRVAIYNLEPPKGVPVDLGFQIGEFATGHVYAQLDASRDYAIRAESPYISQVFPVRSLRVTQWGVPGDPAHDLFRAQTPMLGNDFKPNPKFASYGAPFTGPIRPFLTNPSDCGVDNGGFQIGVDSWNYPGSFTEPLETANRLNVTGCDDERIRFNPSVSLQPTSRAAGGPTGLEVNLEIPQRDQTVADAESLYSQNGDLHGIDTPPLKKAVIQLPEGMTVSPSAAQGLSACSSEQIGLGTNDPVTCPDSSQFGELTIRTPLLPQDEPMHGYVYVAKQGDNPFHNFLSLYFVIEDRDRGLRVKIPGRVDLDPATGQITTTVDDLPQFPVSSMEVSVKGGLRAGLVNPPTCGAKTIDATFYSWAHPQTPIRRTSSYEVTHRSDGSPCLGSLADRPFDPQFLAGTANPVAGAFAPLAMRFSRNDDDQELSTLTGTAPPGLLASLRGLGRCPEAAIAAAADPARTGRDELAAPSCPSSSQIGTVDAGAGVGQVLTWVRGRVYVAGPYRGAPASGVAIVPAVAGPFDLGTIVVRAPAHIDPVTTQLTLETDPLPLIFKGIPVRVRDARVNLDRSGFTLNPTSCDPMSIEALQASAEGKSDLDSIRFQVGSCASLGFRPRLSLRLEGGTGRGAHPSLRAAVRPRAGDANFAGAQVSLPRSTFLDQSHIRTICTRVQFAAGAGNGSQCPPGAVYGRARAWTPLLDEPLEGPVFLRSSTHRLPDLVVALHGPPSLPVNVNVSSRIDTKKGGIRSSFDRLPDVPFTRFVLSMQGGKKGLIQNSTPLCKHRYRADAALSAQNGERLRLRPRLFAVACRGKR
jgi:hypothetical protein